MDKTHSLEHRVGYFQVDHEHRLQLSSLFKLLQEAAIQHANQANIGTRAMDERGQSWILNRVAMKLDRYPKVDEILTIQTWATAMKHFKGFRDFRILVGDQTIGQVSTLWLYIDLKSKSIARLPKEVEATFPKNPEEIYFKDLDRLRLPKPESETQETNITLRYSDIDGNQHVNNAAYMDFLQTALHTQNMDTRPKELQIQFSKEISKSSISVIAHLIPCKEEVRFMLTSEAKVCATGRVSID